MGDTRTPKWMGAHGMIGVMSRGDTAEVRDYGGHLPPVCDERASVGNSGG